MSKVIKISDEHYETLRKVAFENRVSIQHLANVVVAAGMEKCKAERTFVIDRGHTVEIRW